MSSDDITNQEFKVAEDRMGKLKVEPTDQELFNLSGLRNQALKGDATQEAKSEISDTFGHPKFETWKELKGIPTDEAKKDYVEFASSLAERYGVQEKTPKH